MADDTPKEKDAPTPARLPNAKVAVDRTREAAQWLVKAAGGGAAALIASLKLSDIGDLDGIHLALALIGFTLGLAGVVWILVEMGNVLAPKNLSANDVRKDPDLRERAQASASGWLRGYGSLDELIGDFDRADRARVSTYKQVLEADERGDATAMAKASAAHDRAADELVMAGAAVDRLLDYAMTRKTLQQWRAALRHFVLALVVSAGGIVLYAAQSAPADAADDAVADDPVQVIVDLTEAGEQRLRSTIGSGCTADAIPGVATASDDDSYTVVIGDGSCNAAILDVTAAVGTVLNDEDVCEPGCVRKPPRIPDADTEHTKRLIGAG